ncbi:MAG: putative glycosyltransferase EpsE [Bacteroidetes bacterium ADurb.Bin217]|nr:MAG: putative glycosyltransferase EpsE [Bacteroidetes bacterium ADurb.Bin217]
MVLSSDEIEKRINDSYEVANNVINAVPQPMVSVRTSTYQHASYITQCIESILMQKTNFSFEYIIGEDFSTDGTREIVFEYAKKYPDIIRVITADYNVGMKSNGMRCQRAYRGKYIALCEGDDYWTDPLKLQKQVDFLEQNTDYCLCFHNAHYRYECRNSKIFPFNKDLHKHVFNTLDVISMEWFVPPQSIVYRKDLYQIPEWVSFVQQGDIAMLLLLSLSGNLYYIDEIMSVYRKHKTGMGKTVNFSVTINKYIELLCYFDMHSGFKYHSEIEKRKLMLRKKLYKAYFYNRKKIVQFLSFDFYAFKLDALFKKMSNR